MRVLLPIFRDQIFSREQAEGLRAHCEVETSFKAFWEKRGRFDIVQLNWPEELTQWREPTDIELLLLRRVLERWRAQSRIVVTRHNFHPHYADTERYRELYDAVYSAAHAIVHLGEFSRREYGKRYAAQEFPSSQVQEVIPHPVFASYPDNVDRSAARKVLGIGPNSFVLLAFGRVQSAVEKNIVVNAFRSIPLRDKVALVPGWRSAPGREPVNRLRWLRLQHSSRFRRKNRFVPEDEVAAYFRAADLAIIPRDNVLNSGLVSLCIKFDCPMLAPDCGNLKELAELMHCPVFNRNNLNSLESSIRHAVARVAVRPSFHDLTTILESGATAKQYLVLYRKTLSDPQLLAKDSNGSCSK
jgi:hypothetical protein